MQLGFQYKLIQNKQQEKRCKSWIDMLRANYNYNLRDREETYKSRFNQGEYCDIRTKNQVCPLTCPINKDSATSDNGTIYKKQKVDRQTGEFLPAKRKSASEIQQSNLTTLKKVRPWYQDIDSTTLQANVQRLDNAYSRFYNGLGKYPKLKNRSNFKSFTIKNSVSIDKKTKQIKFQSIVVDGNRIKLAKLGWCRFFNSRPIPDGFLVKKATIRLKADGFYVSVLIEDKSVPSFPVKELSEIKNYIGIDFGLTKLIHCSDGSQFNNPRFGTNQVIRRRMRIRQRRVSRKKKGSKNRNIASNKVARLHGQITQRRKAHAWKVAKKIVKKADLIVAEDLNIRAMKKRCQPKVDRERGQFLPNFQSRKRGINRSISDTAWYELSQKIQYLAAKQGKVYLKVNPCHTSQICPRCGHQDKHNRNKEKFLCTRCSYMAHADLNAAENIRNRGIIQLGILKRRFPENIGYYIR